MAKKTMLREFVNTQELKVKLFTSVKTRLQGNWGVPFIAGFIFILILSSVSLAAGASLLAESLSSFGYYVFALGVIVQTACFLRHKKEGDEEVS